ncbi:MAG TPA: succinate:quinone oxidoreductase, partial [Chthoniobacteraceae bacterium]|nr:succinate:quinone oxidoreductase [Chthoniobacteraceae bacterium]
IVFCFVVFHILHFTAETVDPRFRTFVDAQGRHDVYRMVVTGFHSVPASCFYILGMILLCMHLSHGFGSLVQTLGLNSPRLEPWLINGGRVVAIVICLGYISIPLAVMTGVLHL